VRKKKRLAKAQFFGRVGFTVTLMDDGQVRLAIDNPETELWWLLPPAAAERLGKALLEGAKGTPTAILPHFVKIGGEEH
jgi:hypothetical protein